MQICSPASLSSCPSFPLQAGKTLESANSWQLPVHKAGISLSDSRPSTLDVREFSFAEVPWKAFQLSMMGSMHAAGVPNPGSILRLGGWSPLKQRLGPC